MYASPAHTVLVMIEIIPKVLGKNSENSGTQNSFSAEETEGTEEPQQILK